jgi:hypothetical protein
MPRARASGPADPTAPAALRTGWGDEPVRLDPRQIALVRRVSETRPHPPAVVGDEEPERFEPSPAFADWIRETFVTADGPLTNPDHEHLLDARIGVLWTNVINERQQRHILATAEIPQVMGGAWKRGRFEQQLRDWFGGGVPDFLLTFSGPDCRELDDRSFCALVEHELYHCAQALDRFGAPRFNDVSGLPVYAIRGHDVEEFTAVVRRYGPTSSAVQDMVDAANSRPLIGDGPIELACGTCGRAAA